MSEQHRSRVDRTRVQFDGSRGGRGTPVGRLGTPLAVVGLVMLGVLAGRLVGVADVDRGSAAHPSAPAIQAAPIVGADADTEAGPPLPEAPPQPSIVSGAEPASPSIGVAPPSLPTLDPTAVDRSGADAGAAAPAASAPPAPKAPTSPQRPSVPTPPLAPPPPQAPAAPAAPAPAAPPVPAAPSTAPSAPRAPTAPAPTDPTPSPATPAPATPTPRPAATPAPADPAPIARDDHFRTNDAYRHYGFLDFPVFDNDEDRGGPTFTDGSPFRTGSVGQATHGDLEPTSVPCADQSGRWCLRYYPHHAGPFRDGFRYTIVDAGGSTSTATVTIDVP